MRFIPKRAGILACVLCVARVAAAQVLPDLGRLPEQQENAGEGQEEVQATLLYLAARPLCINTASFEELKRLAFLSDSQIDRVIRHRERLGAFRHVNELLLVYGISRADLHNILPFITIGTNAPPGEPPPRRPPLHEILARARARRPLQEGYKRYSPDAFLSESDYRAHRAARFQGPAWGTLLKYSFTAGDVFQAAVTAENDAGEPLFTNGQRTGFDFLSGHLAAGTSRLVKCFVIGDYKLQFGQGLVAWHGFSAGKSTAAIASEKAGRGVLPYSSTDENLFLRGVALATRPARGMTATIFYSNKKSDARIVEGDGPGEEDAANASLTLDGYHRNDAERRRKHAVREVTAGIAMNYNHPLFRVGAHLLYYDFTPGLRVGTLPYQRYNDTGRHRRLLGIDYKSGFGDLYLFGETAASDNRAVATLNGLRYSGIPSLAIAVIYRRYDKRYVSRHAGGFGEYSGTSNEEGVYTGIEVAVSRDLKVNLYHDRFRYFSPRYRATAPASGHETLGEALYQRARGEWLLRVKHERKPEDAREDGVVHTIARVRQDFRLQYTRPWLAPLLETRTRLDHVRYLKGGARERGFLACQDIALTLARPVLRARLRLSYFDTGSYNTRVYVHEHDVLHAYSFPAYSGRGYRSYLNLNWKPARSLTLYAKGGVTYYPDRASISSSLTRVDGNRLFDVTLQLRVKL
jgi:hypothetical protein